MLHSYTVRARAVSPDAFPVPTGFFIWIPNEPYLFNDYRSYLLIQRNTYLQFINVKNEVGYIEKNKVQESVWVSGCAAVLAGRSEGRICLCCLTFVGQNPIRVRSASCHMVINMTDFQYWK